MLAARAGLVPGLPLMHPAFYIRPARVEEAAALSDLCFRSKAVWGYDPEFMALMRAALGRARRGHRCRRAPEGLEPSRSGRCPAHTMAESDFSCPCIIGFGSSPSRCGPVGSAACGRT